MEKIKPGSIGASISVRSRLAMEFLQRLKEQEKLDEALKKELLKAVQDRIRAWLIKEEIINNLFEYGFLYRKVFFNEYPFSGLKNFCRRMKELQRAWRGLVKIRVDKEPESRRVEVKFTAIISN